MIISDTAKYFGYFLLFPSSTILLYRLDITLDVTLRYLSRVLPPWREELVLLQSVILRHVASLVLQLNDVTAPDISITQEAQYTQCLFHVAEDDAYRLDGRLQHKDEDTIRYNKFLITELRRADRLGS